MEQSGTWEKIEFICILTIRQWWHEHRDYWCQRNCLLISYSSSKDSSISIPVQAYFPAFKLPPLSTKLSWALSCLARGLACVFETLFLQSFSHGSIHLKDWKTYNSLQFLIFLKMFSMESSGACQSISFRSGLGEQTTLFLQRAEWLQWVFIVNDKMLWFRKIIFQQSHRNMCFLNHFLWNGVQGLFCPSTQILSHRVLFFSLFIGIYMLLSWQVTNPQLLGFYLSGSPYVYITSVWLFLHTNPCTFPEGTLPGLVEDSLIEYYFLPFLFHNDLCVNLITQIFWD